MCKHNYVHTFFSRDSKTAFRRMQPWIDNANQNCHVFSIYLAEEKSGGLQNDCSSYSIFDLHIALGVLS